VPDDKFPTHQTKLSSQQIFCKSMILFMLSVMHQQFSDLGHKKLNRNKHLFVLVAFPFEEFLFSSFSLPFGPCFQRSCSCRKTRKHDSEHFPCFPAPAEPRMGTHVRSWPNASGEIGMCGRAQISLMVPQHDDVASEHMRSKPAKRQ